MSLIVQIVTLMLTSLHVVINAQIGKDEFNDRKHSKTAQKVQRPIHTK